MSQHLFRIGTDKLAHLHAEAAERRGTPRDRRAPWVHALTWIADRLDVA